MKKTIGTQIVLSGLLSCSIAMFGMNPHQPSPQETQKNPTAQAHTHHHHLADVAKKIETEAKEIGKDIVVGLEKIEDFIHPIVQKGAEDLKQHPEVVIAALNAVGVKQQEAQNITNAIEKGVDIAEKVDASVDNLTQKLEQVKIAKADQNVADAVKK